MDWKCQTKGKITSGVQAAPKPIKIPTGSHGSHSYNMFCSEYFKSDECKKLSLARKNEEAAKKWRDMTSAEKDMFKGKAESLKAPDVSELSEAQKSKLISVHRKKFLNKTWAVNLL